MQPIPIDTESFELMRTAKATPDGRYNGDRLAQGFSPIGFRCKEGVSAVMGAIGRLPKSACTSATRTRRSTRARCRPRRWGPFCASSRRTART